MNIKAIIFAALATISTSTSYAIDHKGITHTTLATERFTLVEQAKPVSILIDEADDKGIQIAVNNLSADFKRVCEAAAPVVSTPQGKQMVIIGSLNSKYIKQLVKKKLIDKKQLQGKREKYLMLTVQNPLPDVDEALVIAGSDKRGTIYGTYELSEQIGVSPWYDWADVPVVKNKNLSIEKGAYTAGEPIVAYRGIFLNDEAPCLTTWVKNTYGTGYGDHRFYARVFELLLRLRANYLWPAMWGWSFYADDPENGKTADTMGIMMGTSHHEPMARNHQEWVRKRKEYGVWDYATNQEVIDRFFREGMERAKNTEDLITIGMRGDGDTAMGGKEGHDDEYVSDDERNMNLLKKIVKNQRQIIKEVTGKAPGKRPQMWALYKEVQTYYDLGLRLPDDVIMLLCDDNWGNLRRLPDAEERKHPGGWGMYYHVDYVGAPRNTKWMDVTPVAHLWEQMTLAYQYGVDKLWVLNVGDLKPMEYPITLFLNMAWNPNAFTAENYFEHSVQFFAEALGEKHAAEAARIFTLSRQYNGRITAEMLDKNTYSLSTGDWEQAVLEFKALETDALRLFLELDKSQHDFYKQLILFPVQAMCNIYEMYYAQAMNHFLASQNDSEANLWAQKVKKAFERDAALCNAYNKEIAGGKWDGMMIQKHIGYTSWNDNFPADRMPDVKEVAIDGQKGGYTFIHDLGKVVIEADHFYSQKTVEGTEWKRIKNVGRTRGGMALMPYNVEPKGAELSYRMSLPADVRKVKVHIITKSTLPFRNADGHCYAIALDNGADNIVNFNANLNENPENIYSIYYPTVAKRIIEKTVDLDVTPSSDSFHTLSFKPLDPAIVIEKVIVEWEGYEPAYLYHKESTFKRN